MIGESRLAVYCASKAGVVNLTRSGPRTRPGREGESAYAPADVDTDMVRRDVIDASPDPRATERALAAYAPLNRIATPQEIAAAILYLASDQARFITGSALQIDGGTTAGHPPPRENSPGLASRGFRRRGGSADQPVTGGAADFCS